MQTELVERARRGDREAFGVLASRSVDRLYAVARLSLRDADLAEDAAQETLVRAWRDLRTLRDPDRFEAWLYRILLRCCAELGRDRRRHQAGLAVLPVEPTIGDAAPDMAGRDELERGLRRLPLDQRTLLVLRFYLDLPVRDVADVLGIPIGTVKSRLHYALEAMRAALEAEARQAAPLREGRPA
ncbi:MAG: sigma-70 family RNA polymerase sigma factor [Chloroflexota bacterium]